MNRRYEPLKEFKTGGMVFLQELSLPQNGGKWGRRSDVISFSTTKTADIAVPYIIKMI
jgi:hypothetical protein